MLGDNTGSVRLRRVGRFTHANQDHPTVPSIGSTRSIAKANTDELRENASPIYGTGSAGKGTSRTHRIAEAII